MPSRTCLFCDGEGPFTTSEHVIPESLGNDALILVGEVCDGCQQYLGKEVERYVLSKTPIGFWRTMLGIRTKKRALPHVDMSVPERDKGTLPERSLHHDNQIGFTAHEDGSTSVDIDDPEIVRGILQGRRTHFQFVLSPKHLAQMGRFLGKIGVELLCTRDAQEARCKRYAEIRRYVRQGVSRDIWPIFHSSVQATNRPIHTTEADNDGVLEHVLCYEYSLISVRGAFDLFSLRVGMDQWTICMNTPFPSPVIREAFPDGELKCMWYSREEWKR